MSDAAHGKEVHRDTITVRAPDGGRATVIVARRTPSAGPRIWVTFDGAIKTTAVFTETEAASFGELIDIARGNR